MKKLTFLIISVILLTGCSTAIAKNNDVVETTKKQAVQNTTTEVKQETKETVAQEPVKQEKKGYTQSDYETYFKDGNEEYFKYVKIDGDYIIVGWNFPVEEGYSPEDSTDTYYKSQVDAVLDMKKSGTQLTKKIKTSKVLDTNNSALVSYVLQANGQTVTFPENSRPVIPQYSLGKYVAEMHARGQEVTTTNARTGIELIKENNERNAQIIAEHNEYMAQQDELFAEIHAEHEERDAESRAEAQENAANRKAFKSVALNAYQKLYDILGSYASYSENIAGKDIGEVFGKPQSMTKDNNVRKINVGVNNYQIPIEVWPEVCRECIASIEESINELEEYTSRIKDSTAQNAQGQIKELNKVKAKFH